MTLFIVVCLMILLDILSGILAAIFDRSFSSTVLRKGLSHKIGYIFLMLVVAIIQVALFDPNFTLHFDFPFFNIVCSFIIFMEVMSILENVCKMNPQLNEFIGKYFKQHKDDIIDIDNIDVSNINIDAMDSAFSEPVNIIENDNDTLREYQTYN